MSQARFLTSIPFSVCKSNFLKKLKNPEDLPQRKELAEFVKVNNIVDISLADTVEQHQAVGLVVNNQYCSLDELASKIVKASVCAKQYFYLAVNKFYIYSTVDVPSTSKDYDSQLVDYCCKIIEDQFVLLKHTTRQNDTGALGNFFHPVTTMFFKRYE